MERYLAGSQRAPLLELHLCNSLAILRMTLLGFSPDIGVLFARALKIANDLDSDRYREEAIHGLFVAAFGEAAGPLRTNEPRPGAVSITVSRSRSR